MKNLLFQKVKCNAYLKKVYDGRCIGTHHENGKIELCWYDSTNEEDQKSKDFQELECECDGSHEFVKTYYKRIEKGMYGFVVGIKNVDITRYLVADISSGYNGEDFIYISKVPKDVIKCAIVYYANNRKRYVPLEDIEL